MKLKDIKTRESSASDAPWQFRLRSAPYNDVRLETKTGVGILYLDKQRHPNLDHDDSEDDMRFIINARNDVPDLIKYAECLLKALEASVRLQSHYAKLLNEYDGGQRLTFRNAEAWLLRLETLENK